MSHTTHPSIVAALDYFKKWRDDEPPLVSPESIARKIVLVSRELSVRDKSAICTLAAFALMAVGKEVTADSIANIVRDAEIGFPDASRVFGDKW